ncbi:Zinc finger, RING/FYVE/PHD-type [Trema orientale]|uniref:Zinc finger, RING/FYVE/PHD-type n=1 Tax=Trema orientale TaxID=63057 RepID=A0A2P5CWD7_TREOI|nr:Zinc finger, RING/FYVE/PHD-type [Trema orientale]
MAGVKRRLCTDSDIRALHKELDEISCPICMDHPHNAVLLLCSSHDKGCRSYICDTSYRHSNCLDRYKKLRANTMNSPTTEPSSLSLNSYSSFNTYGTNTALRPNLNDANENHNLNQSNAVLSVDLHEEQPQENNNTQDQNSIFETQEGVVEAIESESLRERVELDELDVENSSESNLSLKCPLCRGDVLGWEVVEEARKYLNLKRRSCSRESCSFSGNYQELRRHARRIHPATRPSDIDPSRERAWRRLEHQRELGDVVSAIRSAMPGAVVVGDYVIENGDRLPGERAGGPGDANGPWWTTLFLFQMIGSVDNGGEPRPRPRAWMRHHRRSGAAISDRRLIWGENLLGLQDDEDDDDEDLRVLSDTGEDTSPVPRRRRRLTRSRSDEDQP